MVIIAYCFCSQDLRLGTGTVYTFNVQAVDLGSPPRTSAAARVEVFVRRNNKAPYFVGAPYLQTLERNATIGESADGREKQL